MPNLKHETAIVVSGSRVWWRHDCCHGHVAKIERLLVDHRKYRNVSLCNGMKYIGREAIARASKCSQASGVHDYGANLECKKYFWDTRYFGQ
jgi:hypothetical protein